MPTRPQLVRCRQRFSSIFPEVLLRREQVTSGGLIKIKERRTRILNNREMVESTELHITHMSAASLSAEIMVLHQQ